MNALVLLNLVAGCLAALSLALLLWQWLVAARFPLHRRWTGAAFNPGVTLLKPLKGCDEHTRACLRSWFVQEYEGPVQILFGVASAEDPVCAAVRELVQEFPSVDAQLKICGPLTGSNLKVSKLSELESLARHEFLIISDADVMVPADLVREVIRPLEKKEVGLVNCFYRLANPVTLAMKWEAVAVNADFWSQVLQSQTLKPLDFALGAVMATRRQALQEIGGFEGLKDCLADDYQLGNKIAKTGRTIELCPVVVECLSGPMNFAAVWKHQLRWARTIRVCQPLPYFFSILSNATLWPLVWLAMAPSRLSLIFAATAVVVRYLGAYDLLRRVGRRWPAVLFGFLAPIKDLLNVLIWLLAFAGNKIEWRGEQMRLKRDGTLVRNQMGL